MLNITKLATLLIALMPPVASADIEPVLACPMLLTEPECHDFQAAHRQIHSNEERASFERKYAALLKERAQLCPCPTGIELIEDARITPPAKRLRKQYSGQKTNM